jgi:hypothetical protein
MFERIFVVPGKSAKRVFLCPGNPSSFGEFGALSS